MSPRISLSDLDDLGAFARNVADAGGVLAREAFGRRADDITHKGAVDLVTETDFAVEALVHDRLIAETGFAFLGEEDGRRGPPTGPIWIVDPIDGTTNFAHRIPHFAVSIGLWDTDERGAPSRPLIGAVASPIARETFWCDSSRAWLGDDALPPLSPKPLADALLASGFPYDRQTNPDNNIDLWEGFMKRCRGVRRFGAAALDVAWLAAGRVDGFWEPRLKAWDLAAALAILDRVGGLAVTFDGAPHRLDSPNVVAAHPDLIPRMLEVLEAEWRARPSR